MVLNQVQGLKKKSHEVSARKNNNRLRYKKMSIGADSAPSSFRVKAGNRPKIGDDTLYTHFAENKVPSEHGIEKFRGAYHII